MISSRRSHQQNAASDCYQQMELVCRTARTRHGLPPQRPETRCIRARSTASRLCKWRDNCRKSK